MRLGSGMVLISSGNYLLKIKKEELEDGQSESELLDILDYEAIESAGRRGYSINVAANE
jgi:hypothetical protein